MFNKKQLAIFLMAISASVPAIVSAAEGDLIIINNTSRDATSILNNGPCSTILGPSGVTPAHQTVIVPKNIITQGCIFNRVNCQAAVHMTNDCSGPTIAIVTLNTQQGISRVQMLDTKDGYRVSGSGFTASIDGGPSRKNWLFKLLGL